MTTIKIIATATAWIGGTTAFASIGGAAMGAGKAKETERGLSAVDVVSGSGAVLGMGAVTGCLTAVGAATDVLPRNVGVWSFGGALVGASGMAAGLAAANLLE